MKNKNRKKNCIRSIICAFAVIFMSDSLFAGNDVRLLRYPDINGDQIVFVYAGDIWTVTVGDSNARRLTSHKGIELFPKISPDGKWIAFSAEYSGSRQIWVMPSNGGQARQLTYYNSVGVMPPRGGFDNVVLDWTSDSKQILFRTARTPFGERNGMYYLANIDGSTEKPLQIVNGGFAVLSPDDKQICFTPVDREFRTWKRYQGGRATDIWTYNMENNTSEQITDFKGTDQWPVWYEDNIYYTSDKDLRLNIYKYNIKSKQTEQLTFHKQFDVMWPSGSNGFIVYENGGYLYKLDTKTGKTEKVVVNINFDNPNIQPYYKNVKNDIHSYAISPKGKRAVFGARGDIFTVPAKNGNIENLTQTPSVREIYPVWSPNGKYIFYYSDESGEYEACLLENKKGAVAQQITTGSKAWKYEAEWSPDSRYVAYSDRTMNLWLLDIETGKQVIVDKATFSEIRTYKFSPDAKWLTYSIQAPNRQNVVMVYNIPEAESTCITTDEFGSYSPVFSKCGKYIFFVSNRDFNMTMSSFELDYLYNNAGRIYAVSLQNDGTKLKKYKDDIEPVSENDTEKESSAKSNDRKTDDVSVKIDFDNIENRVMTVSDKPGYYRIIDAVENGLLYMYQGKLMMYNIEEEKSDEIMSGVYGVSVSADGKSFLYNSQNGYGIESVSFGKKGKDGILNLDKMEVKIHPVEEWKQIYNDAWRIFRDYFYVGNMHGVNWPAIRDLYAQLLPSVGSRFDLDYVISEMVSEVNVGHAYVNWGDIDWVKKRNSGLLGAVIESDSQTGRYRIAKIYPGESWNAALRSPLKEMGVDVNEGDYILSIDGKNVTIDDNFYAFLENKVNVFVELKVSSTGKSDDARTYMVKPVASELALMADNWVKERRALVDKLSNGRIGYIYIPNTSEEGNRELFKGTYAYHNKEAMIYDDRYNGGGYIPHKMIELIERRTLSYWYRNGVGPMYAPDIAHDGPKVMLVNGYSSSGGDALPYFFRHQKQGKIIGTRTWGGLVGISGNATMVDGGSLNVPCFGIYDGDSNWVVEGVGIYPDIEVVERPEDLASGKDTVIERAVRELLEELDEHPVKKVSPPQEPDRSEWIETVIQ